MVSINVLRPQTVETGSGRYQDKFEVGPGTPQINAMSPAADVVGDAPRFNGLKEIDVRNWALGSRARASARQTMNIDADQMALPDWRWLFTGL